MVWRLRSLALAARRSSLLGAGRRELLVGLGSETRLLGTGSGVVPEAVDCLREARDAWYFFTADRPPVDEAVLARLLVLDSCTGAPGVCGREALRGGTAPSVRSLSWLNATLVLRTISAISAFVW